MDGHRHAVTSADGTEIGLLTAGEGPPLLLVHGGMGCIESWAPLWEPLTSRYQVTAMDRRGRGSSGDTPPGDTRPNDTRPNDTELNDTGPYDLSREFEDVAAVAASLGQPDVFGHSYGAVCALGAAAQGAPVRRLALYEPPGPPTVPAQWRERVLPMIAAGQPGRAMMSFLTEIIGLSAGEIAALRDAPRGYDPMPIVSATMPRESEALGVVDLKALAAGVEVPVLLILGSASPAWAQDLTAEVAAALTHKTLAVLDGQGHDAINRAPELLVTQLAAFFS
jgi:pimeloyl-ACP methyl ester carboxylesterase